MLRIRFFRTGKKHQPSFKIVVTDRRNPPKGGRFVDEVGFWNPLRKENNLKADKIKHWLSKGAKPSDSVYNLLVKEGVLEGKKVDVHKKSKKKHEEKTEEAKAKEANAETAPAEIEKTEESAGKEEKIENPPASETAVNKTEKKEVEEEIKPEEDSKKEESVKEESEQEEIKEKK